MRKYLLGDLREADANQLEVELLANDDRFEQMRDTETSLVDDYVRDRLPSEVRERFERHYLASPIHNERVAFARHLIEKIDETRAKPHSHTTKTANYVSLLETLGIAPVSWKYALSAVILVLAAGTFWLLRERSRLQTELAQIKTERAIEKDQERILGEQVANARDQDAQLTSELEKLRAGKGTDEQRTDGNLPEKNVRPRIFSFTLSPTLVRSGGDQQVLAVPAGVDVVRLQLNVDPSEKRRFNVTVSTVDGNQIWKEQPKLRLDRNGNGSIIAGVPANKLPIGDYILTLMAIDSAGPQEEINRYFFRVLRK